MVPLRVTSEVTTLWRYTNMFIIIIIISDPEGHFCCLKHLIVSIRHGGSRP